MASYTTLVNIDADAALKLSQFIAKLLPNDESDAFKATAEKYIQELKIQEIIMHLLTKNEYILGLEDDSGKYNSLKNLSFDIC